jgi:general secretion pathway protein B
MSYILDALKKAERERGIARVPTLATVHELRSVRRHRPWIIAGAILLSIAAIIWFFLPSSKVVTRPQIISQIGTESNSGAALPSTEAGEASNLAKVPQPANAAPEAKSIPPATDAPSSKPGLPAYETVMRKSVESGRTSSSSEKAAAASQESEEDSSTMEDLSPQSQSDMDDSAANAPALNQNSIEKKPASFREAADKMTLNIHVYSEAKEERLVFIDGKKYLEGDYVGGQYLLEEITPEGAVLSREGEKAILRPGRK